MVTRLTPFEAHEAIRAVMPCFKNHFAPVNPEFLASSWRQMMEKGPARAYGFRLGEQWAGFLLGSILPDLVSGVTQGLEYFWLVQPEHRGKGYADLLLDLFEEDCRAAGAKWIVVGASSLDEPCKRRRKYETLLFSPHCETWYKRL